MLKIRHHRDDELSAEAEARIRADERQRVLAEQHATPDTAADTRSDTRADTTPGWTADRTPNETADRDDPVADRSATPAPAAGLDDRDEDRYRYDDRYRDDDRSPMMAADRTAATTHEEAVREDVVTERGFSPGQILILLAGAASLLLGIFAVVRTGLDGSLSDPVENVLWWDHTALLGLIEIGAGALMILSALHPAMRWLGGIVGLAAIAGGVLILNELDWTVDELGAERDFGWAAIVIGAVAVVGAAIPRVRRTRRVTTTTARPGVAH